MESAIKPLLAAEITSGGTHNANIAVLGDSELILPMKRSGDKGVVTGRGSIDRTETKKAVQEILEGGELPFRRRHEIYGH
jgi:hypothetical protein